MTRNTTRFETVSVLLVVALVTAVAVAASAPFAGVAVADDHDVEYVAGDEEATPGETVTVSVDVESTLDEELAISGQMLDVSYDPDVLEYAGASSGEYPAAPAVNDRTPGELRILQVEGSPVETPFEPAFTLEFEVVGEAGDVSAIELSDVETQDGDGNEYAVGIESGTVTVVEGAWYDPYVDDDGVVATSGLLEALGDWSAGDLETDRLLDLLGFWSAGDPIDSAG